MAPEQLFRSIPGVGPELARRLHEHLDVDTLEALELAAHDGRLEEVPGMGPWRAAMLRASLAGMLARTRPAHRMRTIEPGVDLLLDVDRKYRREAERGALPKIAPRRFNLTGEAWLPILHTERGDWHFTALFSNTARAHEFGRSRDWVVIYFHQDSGPEGQRTVVTETGGPPLEAAWSGAAKRNAGRTSSATQAWPSECSSPLANCCIGPAAKPAPSRRRRGRLSFGPCGLSEQIDHILIAELLEIFVESSDRAEQSWHSEADHLVDLGSQPFNRVWWRHGNREHEVLRIGPPDGVDSGLHRRAGGDAIVDHDRRVALDRRSRSSGKIEFAPALDFFQLTRALVCEVALGDLEFPDHLLVENRLRAGAVDDSADREFRLERRADLTHKDQVEGRRKHPGNLESHRDTAARQSENKRSLIFETKQPLRQHAARLASIRKQCLAQEHDGYLARARVKLAGCTRN